MPKYRRSTLINKFETWLDSRKNHTYFDFLTAKGVPIIKCFKEEFGDIDTLCSEANIDNPFKISLPDKTYNVSNIKIGIDTREKLPIQFSQEIKIHNMKLDFGDYQMLEPYNTKIVIERKSLDDFIGTVGKNKDRFCKELQRAKEAGFYTVILVEAYMSQITSQQYRSKMSPNSIFYLTKNILRQFNDVQVLFCGTRGNASKIIPSLLLYEKVARESDLQYLFDYRKNIHCPQEPYYPVSSWQ